VQGFFPVNRFPVIREKGGVFYAKLVGFKAVNRCRVIRETGGVFYAKRVGF